MNIELRKLQLQKKRVQLGIDELEFKVIEREEDIKRLKESAEASKLKVIELSEEIEKLK